MCVIKLSKYICYQPKLWGQVHTKGSWSRGSGGCCRGSSLPAQGAVRWLWVEQVRKRGDIHCNII